MSRGDWIETALGSVAHIRRGSSPRPISSPRWFDTRSEVGWVRISDIARSDGRTLRNTSQRLSADGIARSREIPPGTLIMSIAATVGRPVITGFPTCIHDGFVSYERLHGVDRDFLFYVLKGLENAWTAAGQTGSQTNVNTSIVSRTIVKIPSDLREQRALAKTLSDTDDLIAALERLIVKKDAIKLGVMQQLLTGRSRLPGFTGQWTESTVGALARVVGGGTPSTRVRSYWNGKVPWFTPAEIKSQGSGLVASSERSITQEGVASSGATLVPEGSVLVTSRASIGNCAVAAVPVTTNQGFTSMVPKDRRSTWFLYYWVQQNRSELESRSAGSTFLEISGSKVAAIPLAYPSLEEQEAIGGALRDIDRELEALGLRLAKARNVKQGMVQQLLTGRTRLPVREAA